MRRLKCSSGSDLGYVFLIAMVLGLAFMLPAAIAPSYASTSNTSSVYVELVTASNDNWTQSAGQETFNFTITNSNSTLNISQINISMPLSGVNAVFAVDNATIGISDGSWNCYNRTGDVDGVGNITRIECSTLTANLTSGSSIYINFTATASSTTTEDVYDWNVTVLNVSGYILSQNVTSGIDGLAPMFSAFGSNVTYFNNGSKMWAKVTDSSLDNSTVNITIVNASNSSLLIASSLTESCVQLSNTEWNCSASWSPSTDGNYTFNISAQDTSGNSNETTSTKWFYYDTTAPSITLNYPVDNGWDDNGNVTFLYTPSDGSLAFDRCSLWLTNDTNSEWSMNLTNHTTNISSGQLNSFSITGLTNSTDENGTYSWNVQCWDMLNNTANSSASTLYIGNRPNLMIMDISWTQDPTPYPGENITVNVTVMNNGTATVNNATNVSFCFGDDSDVCNNLIIPRNTSVVIPQGTLTAGSQQSVYYNVTLSSGHITYYFSAQADYGNNQTNEQYGSGPDESFAGNDNVRTESLTTDLNVTVTNVTDWNSSTAGPKPLENVTIEVTVLYQNGTAVTGLSIENFTVIDRWSSGSGRAYTNMNSSLIAMHDDTDKANGKYEINYTVPGYTSSTEKRYAEYNQHYVKVYAVENATGHNHTGTSTESANGSYKIVAPYLYISAPSPFSFKTGTSPDDRSYTFWNYGIASFSEDISVQDEQSPVSGLTTTLSNSIPSTYLEAGEYYNLDMSYSSTTPKEYTVWVNATTSYNGEHLWYYDEVTVTVTNATSSTDDTTDNGDTTNQQTYECVTNSSCASDKWCKDLECVKVTCPDGYYASNHECKLKSIYEVSIESFADELTVLQGQSVETTLSVENSGNKDMTVILNIELDVDGINVTVINESKLGEAGKSVNYTVKFSASDTAKIGKYEGKYQVTTSSTAKDTEEFTLLVQPLPETIELIKKDYENYTLIYNQLKADFDSVKGQLTGGNLTSLESKVSAVETLFNNLKTAMEDEDYVQASIYMDELNSLINSTRTLMGDLGVAGVSSAFWNSVIMWVIIAVVAIGAVGLLIYMMVPAQGYTLGKGYSPNGNSPVDKIKNILMSIKSKVPRKMKPQSARTILTKYNTTAYTGSYKKLGPAAYKAPKSGMANTMKRVFKKKQ